MSRVPWVFGTYVWPINPETDTGWIVEHVFVEQNTLASAESFFQKTATRSARRRISGWIFGQRAVEFKNMLETWHRLSTRATLTDHLGVSRRAFVFSLSFTLVPSVSEWKQGRATWRYDAEFVETQL